MGSACTPRVDAPAVESSPVAVPLTLVPLTEVPLVLVPLVFEPFPEGMPMMEEWVPVEATIPGPVATGPVANGVVSAPSTALVTVPVALLELGRDREYYKWWSLDQRGRVIDLR